MFKTMLSADWRFLLDHDGWTVPQKNRTIFLKRRSLLFGYFFNRGCCGLIITFDMLSLNSRQCTNNVLKSIVHFSLSKSNKTFIYFSFFRFSPKSSDSNDDFSVSQSNSTIELPLDQSVSAIVLGQSAPSYAYSHFRSVKWPWARSEKENTRLSFYFFFLFSTQEKNTNYFLFQSRPTIGVTPEQPLAISTLIFRALVVARAMELRLLLVLSVVSVFDKFCSFGVLQKIVARRSKIDISFILLSFSGSSGKVCADKLGVLHASI